MEEKLGIVQEIYSLIVNFAVTYSFQLFGAVVVLTVGFIVGGWVSRLLLGVLEIKQVDITLRELIASASRIVVVGLFLIIALSQMGISITPFIAALGGLAVGASFAIQGPVSNYGAGLVIILTRMYKVGDNIFVCGCTGIVREITLATTILESEDNERIVIPNKHIVGEIHRNSYEYRIVEGQVAIAYEADPEQSIALLADRLSGLDGVDSGHRPVVGINRFSDAGVILDYRVWVESERYFEILHQVNLAVYQALQAEGITIPFPHRDVRVVSDSSMTNP
ncbi:MAG: mechanosensitive ion channel family protein [Gammaproteobacteria bacterium]|jgi:small conductance mechanosensitive channel|nr:mechanosensitive ion channel family protein [Gammaproteobacteria bacterium]MBT7371693.1 mechanosensitive ion channel family protein [Gammaproteobacteria bacterium]